MKWMDENTLNMINKNPSYGGALPYGGHSTSAPSGGVPVHCQGWKDDCVMALPGKTEV